MRSACSSLSIFLKVSKPNQLNDNIDKVIFLLGMCQLMFTFVLFGVEDVQRHEENTRVAVHFGQLFGSPVAHSGGDVCDHHLKSGSNPCIKSRN